MFVTQQAIVWVEAAECHAYGPLIVQCLSRGSLYCLRVMAQFLDNSAFARRTLSMQTYRQLRRSLSEQGQQPDTLLITEADVSVAWLMERDWAELMLLVTPTTQGLLIQPTSETDDSLHDGSQPSSAYLCAVGMMTEPQTLVGVIDSLLQGDLNSGLRQQLLQWQQQLGDRPVHSCSDLLLSLLPMLTEAASATTYPVYQPMQQALDRQVEQNLLLNQVITKIRQSLDLQSILSTTVEEVRAFLAADRLLIYQFQSTADIASSAVVDASAAEPIQKTLDTGSITYESCASPDVLSILHTSEGHCFNEKAQKQYLSGQPIAVNDIQQRYQASSCLLDFLQKAQVRALLIAPIVIQDALWGFLIAHHCHTPRQWQSRELAFLQHIAEHLSIAIQQAELYRQLQEQAQSLEVCINSQTQDLRDALTAAQSANLAKSEFLATMSHELRTPLTCIIGMSATLLRWSLGELSPRQRDYLTTIYESGERLLAIINDILEMAKIESGRTVLEVRSFSLTTLAQQALEPFQQKARDRAIELTFETHLLPEQDIFVGDPRRIQQILDNLLSNALKFTGNEGQVNLRVRRENQTAVFQVEDTGIGISEAQIPLLFEKFQQLEAGRQRQYSGTGLGLALSQQLAELHGGSIHVNSRVGVGSVFTVRLPIQRQQPTLPSRKAMLPPAPLILGRIVLVEDAEETAGMICDLLTAADYQVIWVIDGSQVVEQVALLKPAVVILNRRLSGVDSTHIVHALRDSLLTNHVKILALGPLQDESTAIQDADATLGLPLDPEMLLDRVNALVAATSA
ncbi:MAG: ATP-binding protein [Leptolyngbyaceae cyanobacterium]